MAIISRVPSSVYSPSTRAKHPSVNRPSPGSSYCNLHFPVCQITTEKDLTNKSREIQFDGTIRIFDAKFAFFGMSKHP